MREPRPTQSYQQMKLKRLDEGLAGISCHPEHHDNLLEIEDKVMAGLAAARAATNGDITGLSDVVDEVMALWADARNNFLVLSIGLTAFTYRDTEQIRQQLMEYRRLVGQGIGERWLVPYSGEA